MILYFLDLYLLRLYYLHAITHLSDSAHAIKVKQAMPPFPLKCTELYLQYLYLGLVTISMSLAQLR